MFEHFTKEELNCCGIYLIICTANKSCYVGSTNECFTKRWSRHLRQLNNNKHPNKKLQYSWNKYSKLNFEFKILEFAVKSNDKTYLLSREQRYINFYKPQLNICALAANTTGYKHTDVSKEKMKLTRKNQTGSKAPMYGVKGSINPNSKQYKVTNPQGKVYTIKGLQHFCKEHNLMQCHMSSVAKGKRKHHKHWKCEYYTQPISV